ncbi:MAG: FimV/HubP family polar landmark protein [Pseudomonadota bacterium]
MNSALNQRMDAVIELKSVREGDLDGLKISLADSEIFKQHGVDRLDYLSTLSFELMKRPDGTPYIKVTSPQAIREPFLNFLVDIQWSSGRMVRQYTVLVDPPTITEEAPAAPIEAPVVSEPSTVVRTENLYAPVPEPVQIAPPAQDVPVEAPPVADRMGTPEPAATAEGGMEYGRSQRNDTLLSIAKQMRPNDSVSIEQVMLALLRDNPNAFYRNNVNNLKAGYVLRIKDVSQIASISAEEASREIGRQHQEWRGTSYASAAPAQRSAGGEARAPAQAAAAGEAGAPAAASEEARLRLVSPGNQMLASAGTGAGDQAANQALQDALAVANEALTASQSEKEEMSKRVKALEEQVQSMQKLVKLKDEQLASMAAQSAEAEGDAGDILSNPLVLGILAVVVVLVGVLGYLLMRRRKETDFHESILSQSVAVTAPEDEFVSPTRPAAGAAAVAGTEKPVVADREESSLLTDFTTTTMEGLQSDVGEIDPMSEADVYLAYGRYNQAEDIIKQAIASDPTREDFRFKLLEIHHAAKDKNKFVEQAETLRGLLGGTSGATWARVAEMGRELYPEHPLFAGTGVNASEDAVESALDFDFENLDRPAKAAPAPAAAQATEANSLEFDLGDFGDFAKAPPAKQPQVELEEALDFETLSFESKPEAKPEASPAAKRPEEKEEIEFDLGDLAFAEEAMKSGEVEPLPGFEKMELDMKKPAAEPNPFSDLDEVGTKLDLAKAYIDMEDKEGAQSILEEVLQEGNDDQKRQANELMRKLG